jgi:hypothetical protein
VSCAGATGTSRIWKGNPCDVTNGNKYQAEGGDSLAFVRSYNSSAALAHFATQPDELEPLGVGWTATYFRRLSVASDPMGASSDKTLYAFRPDGRVLLFSSSGHATLLRC